MGRGKTRISSPDGYFLPGWEVIRCIFRECVKGKCKVYVSRKQRCLSLCRTFQSASKRFRREILPGAKESVGFFIAKIDGHLRLMT